MPATVNGKTKVDVSKEGSLGNGDSLCQAFNADGTEKQSEGQVRMVCREVGEEGSIRIQKQIHFFGIC